LTLLGSANTRRHKYSQVPSRHHVEVRVVAGLKDMNEVVVQSNGLNG